MGRRPTVEGMEIAAFAQRIGKSLQWARKLKRENAPEWQAFTAAQGSGEPAPPPREPVEVYRSPQSDLDRARQAKELAWKIYQKAAADANRGSTVMSERAALNRAAKEAREAYEKACKHAAAAEVQAREWIPVSEVLAMRPAFRQLEDTAQNWETTVLGYLPDEMRPAVAEACAKARASWNAGIMRAENEFQSRFPTAC